MKRFGWAIRTGGDPEIREALEDGIRRGTGGTTSSGAVAPPSPKGEGYKSEAVRRVAMMRHTPEEWREMRLDARRRYRRNRSPHGVGKALLVGYAMVCYGARLAFDWLWEAIERRTEA